MAIITLLTDFGLVDEYVGVVKGVIRSINPSADVIDVTHGIAPQNIVAASYTLKAAYGYFPKGSIHVTVVDPGVGTVRDVVAVRCAGHIFLAPDNGLLAPILDAHLPEEGYRVENENLFRHPVSSTFHGRDVFAPVAAHLSNGLPLKTVGSPLDFDKLQLSPARGPRVDSSGELQGEIVGIDRFGNLITNLDSHYLSTLGTGKLDIFIRDRMITGVVRTYAQCGAGEVLAVVGSRNCLEIAVNGASASETLNSTHGDIVRVKAHGQ
jgi:S-adenosylmethionine hydrolase